MLGLPSVLHRQTESNRCRWPGRQVPTKIRQEIIIQRIDFKASFKKRRLFSERRRFYFINSNLAAVCIALAIASLGIANSVFANCGNPNIKEQAGVESVVDGDTIRLANHQLVRLIGVNTPEIHYDGTPSEPLALAAKDFLARLLRNHKTVGLAYEAETKDHYGRRLAHVFIDNGDSRSLVDVQLKLLENGLGFWVAIPPNIGFSSCYFAAEAKARQKNLGVWGDAYFNPKNAAEKTALKPGYQWLQGKIIAVYRTKNSVWLKFNDQVALRIAGKDIHNFEMSALYALKGKTLTARGWLHRQNHRLTMQIRLPAAMELQP